MAEFKDADQVSQIAWQLREGDWPRDVNRTRINELNNGVPPYTEEQQRANNVNVNVNFLTSPRLLHDARMQMAQGILKPGLFFEAKTDAGPASKRSMWNTLASQTVNTPMKKSMDYYECQRSKIALTVLHGIAPACWENDSDWCPIGLGVEDLLIPSNTLLTFRNLPFFVIGRSFTAPELIKLARGKNADPAWNKTLVDQCLEWIDRESMALLGSNWPEVWSPSKIQERVKGDGGYYMGDQVPTIDVFDFYYWSEENKEEGWRRRIVLDDWSTPASSGAGTVFHYTRNSKLDFGRNQWLYNPGSRVFASKREHIFSCSFADLSAVGPFRYHSVRSLGFLLWAVCHLENRLRCAFTESVFESLLMYFRVKSADDAERVIKLQLAQRGIIDESVDFIKAADRYQVNQGLVELGLQEIGQLIAANSSSFSQSKNLSSDRVEKTKFQVQAEVSAAQSMVSAALQQAYTYQAVEYREIFRRFLNPDSRNIDVLNARKILMRSIPEKYLVPEAWDIEPVRLMGGGNKTLEMAQAEQLMQFRPLYDPAAQRQILRDVTLAITDDPAKSMAYVPDEPVVSDSVHDTELAFSGLMQGNKVTPRPGLNAVEVGATMLTLMDNKVKMIMQQGGVGTPQDLIGFQMAAQYAAAFIQQLGQSKEQKPVSRALMQALSKVMNEVKAMAQRQQEMQKKAMQNGQGGLDPKDIAKLQAIKMQAQVKAQNAQQSHAQKTQERQIQFQQDLQQTAARNQLELRTKAQEAQIDSQHDLLNLETKAHEKAVDLAHKTAQARIDVRKEHAKSKIKSTKEKE
jgi:hypothetical protein